MDLQLITLQKKHQEDVMKIFNYYIKNSFSAYFTVCLPPELFDSFLQSCQDSPAYAAECQMGRVVGFGLIKPFHPGDAVKRTGEISYFIDAEYTRQGIGRMLLNKLTKEAKRMGIDNLVANVSSHNEQSLNFHKQNGFIEVGILKSAGRKFDQDFDVIILQKQI